MGAALVTLATAKHHLRIAPTFVDDDEEINDKAEQASAAILRYLKGRRLPLATPTSMTSINTPLLWTGTVARGKPSSITSSAGLATVTTAVPHGLSTNDTVTVWGAEQAEYNGIFTVTVTGTTTFTYAISGTPLSPATGSVAVRTAENWTYATVPQDVQAAVLLLLAHLYEHRGDDIRFEGDVVWTAIDRLLVSYKDPALA